MKAEIARTWVEALRSGDYEQGRRALNRDGKYCCLGVLCELAVAEGVIEAPERLPKGDMAYAGCNTYLPQAVCEWAGIDSPYGKVYKGSKTHLATLNDEYFSFNQIADIIDGRSDT